MLAVLLACFAHTLPPAERTLLMTRVMREPFDPGEAAFLEHTWEIREAMSGAAPAGGAPCGCN